MTGFLGQLSGLLPRNANPSAKPGHKNRDSENDTKIGPASESELTTRLKDFYWAAVEKDLGQLIKTLQEWNLNDLEHDDNANIEDNSVSGFDSFLDQVNIDTRRYAHDYRARKKERERSSDGEIPSYDAALRERAYAMLASQQSQDLREDVRAHVEVGKHQNKSEQRARMLLQSAGWLDMDKLIEHRPRSWLPKRYKFWKRVSAAQLQLAGVDRIGLPFYEALRCAICDKGIRGSMFQCNQDDCHEPRGRRDQGFICQDCYDDKTPNDDTPDYRHPREHLVKDFKHCVLHETVTRDMSSAMCRCTSVLRMDRNGQSRTLFPLAAEEQKEHRAALKNSVRCGLLSLNEVIAEAKYSSMAEKDEKQVTLADGYREAKKEQAEQDLKDEKSKPRKRTTDTSRSKWKEVGSLQITEEDAARDVPWYMRPYQDNYAFGNVHMALRFGPLVIENGVGDTHGGAVITSRPAPYLEPSQKIENEDEYMLMLSPDRTIWERQRLRGFKRYKSIMKQVVGGAFCGLLDREKEDKIVRLLAISPDAIEKGRTIAEKQSRFALCVKTLLGVVKEYITPRLRTYLRNIVKKLLDPNTDLHWNRESNSCQTFCDSLISTDLFSGLVHSTSTHSPVPLYLLSFVCRPSAYTPTHVETKFDVPNGLIEEYLLSFRYGRHLDSDLLDTLSEYWHDWAGFNNHLYPHQALFPWDCTEAYGRTRDFCGECSLSKHVWAFPFDSFSAVEMHLSRPRGLYPGPLSDREWMQNRLAVLDARSKLLSGACAMARSDKFHKATAWLGSAGWDPASDRLKLGGIHRAQPYSHQYDQGVYFDYFTAGWASLRREDQIRAYEAQRLVRVNLPELVVRSQKEMLEQMDSSGSGPDGDTGGMDAGLGEDNGEDADGYGDELGAYVEDGWDGDNGMFDPAAEAQAEADANADVGGDFGGDAGGEGGDGGGGGG